MGRKVLFAATAAVAMIVLSACSESPKPAAKEATEAKPEAAAAPEAVPAFKAYYEMYKPARTWATDLLALNVKDGEVPNVKNEGGKAGMWTAVFVSPSRKEARTFTWVAADSGDLHKGITIGDKQVWGGATPTSKAFVNSEFAVNSDAAFKVAAEKAAEWLKAHPGVKYTMTLGNTSRFPAPVWYIMWGTAKDGYAVYVNATTGEVVTR
jgi:hypothetical protein